MLYFSIQNARGGRERYPRLRGGLRTDGFIDVSSVFSKFLRDSGRSFFVAGAAFGEFGQ